MASKFSLLFASGYYKTLVNVPKCGQLYYHNISLTLIYIMAKDHQLQDAEWHA